MTNLKLQITKKRESPFRLYSLCNPARPRAGFTLIEVMISVGIGALLIAVSTLYLAGYRSNQHIETQAGELVALLQSAQEKSASQENNARWGVLITNPSSAPATFALYQVDEALLAVGEPFSSVPGAIIEQLGLPDGVSFSDPASGGQTNIVFARGTGLPISVKQAILQSGGTQKTVYVDANGRIEYR